MDQISALKKLTATSEGEEPPGTGSLSFTGTREPDELLNEGEDVPTGIRSFEDLLDIVGTSGIWNITFLFVCSLSSLASPFQEITYEFLGATPDYWCQVDPLMEANWTPEQIVSFAIPPSNGSELKSCLYYNYNYTSAAKMGYEKALGNLTSITVGMEPIPCTSRVFNTTQQASTTVTEWDLVCDRRALYSTTQAITQAGNVLSSWALGFLQDKFGRRPMVILSLLLGTLCGVGSSLAQSYVLYIVFKFLSSCFENGYFNGSFVQVMEICSLRQRSYIGNLYGVPYSIGFMLVPAVSYFIRPWRWLQAAYTLPLLVALLLNYKFVPESPRWLISKGRYEEAFKVLYSVSKKNGIKLPSKEDVILAMENITSKKESKEERLRKSVFSSFVSNVKHLFMLFIKPELRYKALICFYCWTAVGMIYFGVSLNAGNLSMDPYMYIFLGGVIELPSYAIVWVMLTYMGRRISQVTLFLVCALTISTTTILLSVLGKVQNITLMSLSLLGKLAVTGSFSLIYVYTAELFPTKYRSLALGEASMMAGLGALASPYINDLLGDQVTWGPSAVFALASAVAAALSLFLEETKGCDLKEEDP